MTPILEEGEQMEVEMEKVRMEEVMGDVGEETMVRQFLVGEMGDEEIMVEREASRDITIEEEGLHDIPIREVI